MQYWIPSLLCLKPTDVCDVISVVTDFMVYVVAGLKPACAVTSSV
jgi:hypothetical protein